MALGTTLGLGIVITAKDVASATLGKVDRAYRQLDNHVGAGAERMGGSFGGLSSRIMRFASAALASFGIFKMLSVAGDFEEGMAKVAAVTGATTDQMKQLKKAALEAGVATQYTPIEASGALLELAQAGYSVDESIQLLIPTLDLAAASFGELTPEAAAGLAAQALKAFGLQAKDASKTVDQMLQSVNLFSLTAADLSLGLGVASRGASVMGQSLNETLISLGMTKDILGSLERSSTSVAVAMQRMANPQTRQQLAGIGVAVADAKGHFRNFLDIVADLQPRLAKMKPTDQAAFLQHAFGDEAVAGVEAMFKRMDTGFKDAQGHILKGAAAVAYLRDQFEHADGTALRFRETMLATFKGQARQLLGSIITLSVVLASSFAQLLTPIVHAVTTGINVLIHALMQVPEPVMRVIASIGSGAVGLVAFGAAVIGLHRAFLLMRTGWAMAKLALMDFWAALWPVALVVAAVAVVVAGFYIAYKKNFGGIADMTDRFVHDVSLAFRALYQLFSDGAFSGAVRREIDKAENSGLKRFVITMYMVGYRIKRIWDGIVEGFEAAIDAARPAFSALFAAFRELGEQIGGLVGDITGAAAGLPSARFLSFGQMVGSVFGTILGWVVTVWGWLVRFTSGVIAGFRAMEDWIKPVFEVLGKALSDLKSAFEELFGIESYGSDEAVTFGDAIRGVGEVIGKVVGGAFAVLIGALTFVIKLVEYVIRALNWLKEVFISIGEFIGEAASQVSGFFGGVVAAVAGPMSAVIGVFSGIAGMVMKVVNVIRDAIGALVDALEKALHLVKEFFDGIWDGLKGVGGALGSGASWVGGKAWGAASAVGGFVEDTASSIFSGPSLADTIAEMQGSMRAPTEEEAKTHAMFMQAIHALPRPQDLSSKQPTTVNVQLQVEGEVLARATAKATEDAARRSFVPVPVRVF